MNSSQRWFLVTSLILLAVGVALYCLNYRVVDADSSEGRVLAILLNSPKPERESLKAELENSPERRAVIPLVSFGESQPRPPWEETHGRVPTDSELSSFLESKSTFSGIYPRTGLSPLEATIGGVLVPILLLISASYLALGARKTTSNKETTTPTTTLSKSASTEIDQSAEQQSEIDIPKPEQLAELREPSKQGTRAAISGLLITGVVACTGVGLIIAGSSDGGAILMFLILTLEHFLI